MFSCRELVKDFSGNWNLKVKKSMKYARHGHSACEMGDRFIVVTGSRKDHDKADKATELYDGEKDTWTTLAPMNTGRHYHSSCSLN
jgi:hypothetical protein